MTNEKEPTFLFEHEDHQGAYDTILLTVQKGAMAQAINGTIKKTEVDTNLISDGYHTFGELYEHRITLFIALCRQVQYISEIKFRRPNRFDNNGVWRSETMSDGSRWEGWFLLGIGKEKGSQITYHLPVSKWTDCEFAETLAIAPEFDGHTSADVLERLAKL